MGGHHFDLVTMQLGQVPSRRRVGTLLAALDLRAGLGSGDVTEAKRKK